MKSARAAKDLSQQQLADLVGVSRQTINAIEKRSSLHITETVFLIDPWHSKNIRPAELYLPAPWEWNPSYITC